MTNKIPPSHPPMIHKILKNNTIENIITFMKNTNDNDKKIFYFGLHNLLFFSHSFFLSSVHLSFAVEVAGLLDILI